MRSTGYSRVWPIDCGPANIIRRDVVCSSSKAAPNTLKDCLSRPIALIHEPAARTCARSVAWIDTEHDDTCECGLISNLLFQIQECPAMQCSPLVAPNRYPVPNAIECLECDSAAGALGLGYNAFADAVVDIASEQRFALPAMSEQALGGLGSFLLELPAQPPMAMTQCIEMRAAEGLTVGVGGNIHDTKVNTEYVGNILWPWFLNVTDGEQIEVAAKEHEIGFTLAGGQQSTLALAALEGNSQTAVDRPDGNLGLAKLPGKDAVVISNCAEGSEASFALAIELVGIDYFGHRTYSSLCRQVELLTDRPVAQVMQCELAEGFAIPGGTADGVAGVVNALHGQPQGAGLCNVRSEFHLRDQLHKDSITEYSRIERALLPALKAEVSA